MASQAKHYHRPADLLARIGELERLCERRAASFADLEELASLENRRFRRMSEGSLR